MSHFRSRYLRISAVVVLLGLLTTVAGWALGPTALADVNPAAQLWNRVSSAGTERFSADPVTAAWERVQDAGSYHFTSDVVQITIPTAKVTNVGRPSRTEQLYLEGQSDLDAAALEFQLWTEGGNVHDPESGLSVRAADGKSYTRQGTGEWAESSSFSDDIAPAGDFMAYLAAARDITAHEPETRAGITFTRYSFQIDGPTFAVFTRNQTEAGMRARGELPNGVHFEVPSYYHDMTGDGELWVRENGLPLRQLINLRFPEQDDATVQAQIQVDFSHFGQTRYVSGEFVQVDPAAGAGSAVSLAGFSNMVQRQAPAFGSLLALLSLVGLAALVVAYRREHTLQVALSLAVIASLVVGPILGTLKMTGFLDTQVARAAEQSAAQKESALLRDLRSMDAAPQFNPHQNPLAAASAAAALAPSMAASAAPVNVPALQATNVLTIENPLQDTDDDGLNDFVEQRIGTSTVLADTDGDQISDKVEVDGFTTPDGKWYLDPLNPDSNGDGIADTLEYDIDGNNQPDDTDNDKVPDLFDDDNDGDGIPDRMDLAPFAKSPATGNPAYGESNPLLLKVDNLTGQSSATALPTFVDFQIRPDSVEQLRVAGNLLDWPQDNGGQIQDIDDLSEDLELVPMLEIRIPNGAAMLPAESALEPYGISVGDDEIADGKIAYVPLNLVTDPQSGERVAFSGRMLYLPQAAWQQPHSVRLVWIVKVNNDFACGSGELGYDSDSGYCLNQPQIVHRYYEDWILTGLNVIEEHGADMAIIYEDPAVRSANDGAMWLLAGVLGERFLTAGDNGNGIVERAITMANLEAELDLDSNSGTVVYGLPNNFQVVKEQHSTFDEAIYRVGTETATSVLNSAFTDNTKKPLLLYAYETNLRSIGLDASRIDSSYASFSGAQLTMNFNPGSQSNTPIETTAGFKWTPYCGSGSPAVWDVCDPVEYWQELETRHGAQYLDPDTLQLVSASSIDPDVAEGEMVATQLYALSMLQGFNAPVLEDGQLVTGLYSSEDDTELTNQVAKGLLLGTAVAKWEANRRLIKGLTSFTQADGSSYSHSQLIKRVRLGRIDNRGTFSTIGRFPTALRAGAYSAMGLVLVGTAVAASLALAGYEEAEIPAQVGIGAIQSAAMVGVPVRSVFVAAQESGGLTKMQILRGSSAKIGYTQKAGAIGAGLAITVTWGVFIATAAVNNMVPFGAEFNSALADTIASTILIILLTIIAFNPVGLIIVGIIAVLDILLTLLCEYGGADGLRNDFTGGCFTISGAATKVIAYALYNYELMINTSKQDLVSFGAPDVTLATPSLGYAEGNQLSITMPITTHVVHKDPEVESGLYINFYLWLYNKGNLRSSTFKYSATQPNEEKIGNVERDQITSKWFKVSEDHKYVLTPMYGGFYTTTVTVDGITPQVGINEPAKFYHNMGFAIPAYECWVVPNPLTVPVPVCYTRTFKSNTSEPIETIVFDIFPATLDQFLALANKSDGGRGLAWDEEFRSLQDADGDGLLAVRYGGLDSNDTTWDTDGDGLSDSFEHEQRQAGVNVSPQLQDKDQDGLTDAQELHFGTDPAVSDSDNDGLLDGAEIWHQNMDTGIWEGGLAVEINSQSPFKVHVSSDPNARDSDNDGVSDGAEYQLAGDTRVINGDPIRIDDNNVPYHPNIVNTPPMRIYLSSDAVANRYVSPGQQFVYTTTVVATAPLAPGVLDLTVLDSNGASSGGLGVTSARVGLPFDPLGFSTNPTVTQQTNFTASNIAPETSASFTVSNTVRTLLEAVEPGPWNLGTVIVSGWQNNSVYYPWFNTVTPRALGSSDEYQTASKHLATGSLGGSPGANPGQNGALWTRDFEYSSVDILSDEKFVRTLEDSTTLNLRTEIDDILSYQLPNRPDIACNDGGTCMVVWDYVDACSTVTIDSLTVTKRGNDGGAGLEPVLYLVRASNGDFDPADGGYEHLWSAKNNYDGNAAGNNIPKDIKITAGFPVEVEVCNGGAIRAYESENQGAVGDLLSYNTTDWPDQDAMSSFDLPREGGFWNYASDTQEVTFSGGCGGCEYKIEVTNPSKQVHKVAGALIGPGPDGVVTMGKFNLSSFDGNTRTAEFYRPIVATDGNEFLVAWEVAVSQRGPRNTSDNTVLSGINTRRFAADGTPLNDNTRVTDSNAVTNRTVVPIQSRSRSQLEMEWLGDRYLLTRMLWPHEVNTGGGGVGEWSDSITTRELGTDGQLRAGTSASRLTSSIWPGGQYDWDYDPINNQGLIAYFLDASGPNRLVSQIFRPTSFGYGMASGQTDIATGIDSGSPQVEYDPATKGWMLGWTASNSSWYQARDEDSAVALASQNIPDASLMNSNALACPAPQSLPLVDLRFEELPGATTFVDDSGFGNDATCSGNNCPLPGAVGAPEAALSAYALEFDGSADSITLPRPNQLNGSFSLAFWYKANQASWASAPFVIESNQPSGFGLFVRNNQDQVEWHVANKSVLRAAIANNQWHFIVGTYERGTGAVNLYVDGNQVGQGAAATQAATLGQNIEIRGADNLVGIDQLQIYQTALSESAVKAIYARSNNAFCFGITGSNNSSDVKPVQLSMTREEGALTTISDGASSIITVDNDKPSASVTGAQFVDIDEGGSTILTIGGTAQDPTSGIGSVAVSVNGSAFEPAKGRESWTHQFSIMEGSYTIQAKATDVLGHVGNVAEKTFIADATPPQVTINTITNPVKPVLNGDGHWQVSLSGTANDPAIGQLSGSGIYTDSVQVLLTGAGGPGVGDQWQTATYNENNQSWMVDYVFPAARIDVTGSYTVSVRAEDRAGSNGGNNTGDSGATAILQLAHIGPAAALSTIDAARQFITDSVTIGGPVISPIGGIAKVEVAFATVEQIAALGSGVSAEDAQTQLDADDPNRWLPAALVQQGIGITSTTWSLVIPANLEGEYQIDLRGTDGLANELVSPKAWRGIIDTQAPRVSIVRTNTGSSYTSGPFVQPELIKYECVAKDRYLSEPDFVCPSNRVQEPTRIFNTDPRLQALFPDRTILTSVTNTSYRWETESQPETIEACDLFGKCTTASTGQTVNVAQARVASAAAAGVLQALVISPVQERYVAADGDLPVTIVAEAPGPLQQVTVELDNTLVRTYTFEQSENITRTQRTLAIPNVTEGVHTLVAKATDWTGAVQTTLYPVTFTLDAADPTIMLNTDLLRLADTWALGSDMLRFKGKAGDSVGLAAVQIKIGDAPFVEAGFDENSGDWSTAQLVPDPEGKTLTVSVRAIDKAGRISSISGAIGVDLTPTETTITLPDTTITPTVVNAGVNSVSVSFAGVDGTNAVAAFECRLDDGLFQPCASPQQYDGLHNGVNHFEARAIDDHGFVDSTPAGEDWTIAVAMLQVTLTAMPSNPTFSRDAAFDFTGASGYECSLDGLAYTVCNSPQSYTNLGDGSHTLLVRGLDGSGNKGAATRFVWQVQNQLPVAGDQLITTFRDTPVVIALMAEDSDDLTYRLVDMPANGTVDFTTPPNVVTYSPDSGFAGVDSFTFEARDAVGKSNLATVTVVTNFEPTITTGAAVSTVQYGDGIAPITITIDDLDSPGNTLTLVASNLPEPLTLTRVTDNGDAIPGQSVWTLAGTADLVVGAYVVTLVADDGVGGATTGDPVEVVIEVVPEDVMVRFHGGNPRAVRVEAAGDENSGPFDLRVDVKELYPDSGAVPQPGDISQANVSMQLVPIGPGGPAAPTGCTTELHDVDYDARLTLTCGFDVVPINTYAVEVTVGGANYAGYDEDVVTVYDPARGFTTGGGSMVSWPGASGGEINFGFGMEYNKQGKKLKGRLMVKRQLDDGSVFRLKSNALDALALGADQASGFTWATFSGKANFYSSATDSTEGNYTFIAYVEDHGDTGDTFWLQVKDKDGIVVDQLSLAEPAAGNAAVITSGDIVVPAGEVRSADSGDDPTGDDPNVPAQETPTEETPAVEDEATGNDASGYEIFLPFVRR